MLTRRRLNIDENSFAIYTTLKNQLPNLTTEQATAINGLFNRFPDYRWAEEQKRDLRTELYKVLRSLVGAKNMVEVANSLLKLQRI